MARYAKTYKGVDIVFKDYVAHHQIIKTYRERMHDYAHWVKYMDMYEVNVQGRVTRYVPRYQVKRVFMLLGRVNRMKPSMAYYYLLADFVIRTNCMWLMPNEYMAGQDTWINNVESWCVTGKLPSEMTEEDLVEQKKLADYMRTDKLANYNAEDRTNFRRVSMDERLLKLQILKD